jgi:hypothetical protein
VYPERFSRPRAGDDAFVLWAVVLVVFSLAGAALSLVFGLTR